MRLHSQEIAPPPLQTWASILLNATYNDNATMNTAPYPEDADDLPVISIPTELLEVMVEAVKTPTQPDTFYALHQETNTIVQLPATMIIDDITSQEVNERAASANNTMYHLERISRVENVLADEQHPQLQLPDSSPLHVTRPDHTRAE